MEPLRLAICDDLPEEREALLALLEQAPIATVCAQFASSEELLEAFRPGGFDLLLMDISVKVGPGHGHLKRAQKTSPANQEVFRARVSKWEEVRQNQRRSCLGIQGT